VRFVEGITNPLPSVLMLTAIVVGLAVQALGFALLIKVKKDYGTLEEDEIIRQM
jgi:multicomponent Na+:H+ antiporter subunit C